MSDEAFSVEVYARSSGGVSVCAPRWMRPSDVANALKALAVLPMAAVGSHGIEWRKADVATFTTGEPNPCDCERAPSSRRHWCMEPAT